jgi:hypothetical protein
MNVTPSQLVATAKLHERIAAANARFNAKRKDAPRHAAAAKMLRERAKNGS